MKAEKLFNTGQQCNDPEPYLTLNPEPAAKEPDLYRLRSGNLWATKYHVLQGLSQGLGLFWSRRVIRVLGSWGLGHQSSALSASKIKHAHVNSRRNSEKRKKKTCFEIFRNDMRFSCSSSLNLREPQGRTSTTPIRRPLCRRGVA